MKATNRPFYYISSESDEEGSPPPAPVVAAAAAAAACCCCCCLLLLLLAAAAVVRACCGTRSPAAGMDGRRQQEIELATEEGLVSGAKAFASVGAASAACVFALHRLWPRFRFVGVSGRAALVFSPPMFAFFLASEQAVVRRAQRR